METIQYSNERIDIKNPVTTLITSSTDSVLLSSVVVIDICKVNGIYQSLNSAQVVYDTSLDKQPRQTKHRAWPEVMRDSVKCQMAIKQECQHLFNNYSDDYMDIITRLDQANLSKSDM